MQTLSFAFSAPRVKTFLPQSLSVDISMGAKCIDRTVHTFSRKVKLGLIGFGPPSFIARISIFVTRIDTKSVCKLKCQFLCLTLGPYDIWFFIYIYNLISNKMRSLSKVANAQKWVNRQPLDLDQINRDHHSFTSISPDCSVQNISLIIITLEKSICAFGVFESIYRNIKTNCFLWMRMNLKYSTYFYQFVGVIE